MLDPVAVTLKLLDIQRPSDSHQKVLFGHDMITASDSYLSAFYEKCNWNHLVKEGRGSDEEKAVILLHV